MGRHRKKASSDGDIIDEKYVSDNPTTEAVEDRLGLNDQVCTACDIRNPPDRDTCRKCGHGGLRPKASEYRDG